MRIAAFSLVILTLVTPLTAEAHEFSWDNLLIAKIKLDKAFDHDTYVDAYMQVFRPNVWKRYRNDEFELEDRRQETIKLMQDRIESFRLDELFELHTTVTFGKYDFSRSHFPVVEATSTHYWSTSRYSTYEFPSSLRVFFKNAGIWDEIPMEKSAARSFLGRRKERDGDINRRITATVQFKIVELKDSVNELSCEIQSVRFFEDERRTRLLHEVKKPESGARADGP